MKGLLGRAASDFSLLVVGGGTLTLSSLRGFIVVLNFWSAECPWSRRADVVLVYRQLTWEPKGVRILGIASNVNESEAEIHYEAENRQVKYPILLDPEHKVADLYHAETTPHFFILDRKLVIRYVGALDDATFKQREAKTIFLDQAVNALFHDRAPEPAETAPYGCAIVRQLVSGSGAIAPTPA